MDNKNNNIEQVEQENNEQYEKKEEINSSIVNMDNILVDKNKTKNSIFLIIIGIILIILGIGGYFALNSLDVNQNENNNNKEQNNQIETKNDINKKTIDDNNNLEKLVEKEEELENNVNEEKETDNDQINEEGYTFIFKNTCDTITNEDAVPYVNIYLNGKLLKKLDGYQQYTEKEINNKKYYILSTIKCTDLMGYDLVLDENLNETYKAEDFVIYTSNKYIIIAGNKGGNYLLDYNWNFVKKIDGKNIYVGDNYYLKLEENDYNIYDYDNKFIGKLFTKTEDIDLFFPFGRISPTTKIENGEEIVYISAMNYETNENFYPYYNITTKESGIMKD